MLPDTQIDRESPIPFYFQLSELLEHEIARGDWEPEMRLPSEQELCDHFAVSRTTVRQALARLEQEGLVSRRKGQGTFVRDRWPRSWLVQASGGFFQEEEARTGHPVTSQVRRVERGVLPAWAADTLSLASGGLGVTLERIRSSDGLIAMYNVNYLPERFAETVVSLRTDESLYQRLREEHGVEAAGGRRVLEAVSAEARLASLLDVPPHTPLAYIESVVWDRSMQPFDCSQSWLRTDRMKIDIEVVAAPVSAAATLERIRELTS
jgi:GntR family transcriptional regulator